MPGTRAMIRGPRRGIGRRGRSPTLLARHAVAHSDEPTDLLIERGEFVVAPDGSRIQGWLELTERCADCGAPQVFAVMFDAYLCMRCNRWLEAACDDPGCEYCRRRPATPLGADGGCAPDVDC